MFDDEHRRDSRIFNPDTGFREAPFRERVREVLGLPFDTRDTAIFAELKRLKTLGDDEAFKDPRA